MTATDVAALPLRVARELGADETLDARSATPEPRGFDVAFEASGAPAAAATCLASLRTGGRLVLIGLVG